MEDYLVELIKMNVKTSKILDNMLYELCDDLHACDCYQCPVYIANGNSAPGWDKPFDENRGCDCFKNGKAMREFLQSKEGIK